MLCLLLLLHSLDAVQVGNLRAASQSVRQVHARSRRSACRLRGCPEHAVGRANVLRQLMYSDRLLLQLLTIEKHVLATVTSIVVERHGGEYSHQVGGML